MMNSCQFNPHSNFKLRYTVNFDVKKVKIPHLHPFWLGLNKFLVDFGKLR